MHASSLKGLLIFGSLVFLGWPCLAAEPAAPTATTSQPPAAQQQFTPPPIAVPPSFVVELVGVVALTLKFGELPQLLAGQLQSGNGRGRAHCHLSSRPGVVAARGSA